LVLRPCGLRLSSAYPQAYSPAEMISLSP
jgi:hypothetical protein